MPIDPIALKTMIDADAESRGYKTGPSTYKDDKAIARLANEKIEAIRIDRGIVSSWQVLDALDSGEFGLLTADENRRLGTIIKAVSINVNSDSIKGMLRDIFPAGSTSREGLIALTKRDGSDIEKNFGSGKTIGHLEVAGALR